MYVHPSICVPGNGRVILFLLKIFCILIQIKNILSYCTRHLYLRLRYFHIFYNFEIIALMLCIYLKTAYFYNVKL